MLFRSEGEDKGEIVDEMAVAGAKVLEDPILTDAVVADGPEHGREGSGGAIGLDIQGIVQFLPGCLHAFEGEISGDAGEDKSDNLLPVVRERFGENRDEILELQGEKMSVTVFVHRSRPLQGSHRTFFLRWPGRTPGEETTIRGEPAKIA